MMAICAFDVLIDVRKQRSLLVFEESIRSPNTLKLYMHNLGKFMKYFSVKDYDSLLAIPDDKLQVMLEDYLFYLKKHLSPNTIPVAIAPIELFFTINDKNPNFRKLHKMYPSPVKKSGKKAWTTKDIQNMLKNTTKKRTRSIILFLSSTGSRIGTIEEVRLRNLVEMPGKCKAVQFYEGTNEEYWGFLTPESSKTLDGYLQERQMDGEQLGPDSPVFRGGYRLASLPALPISKKVAQLIIARCINDSEIKRTKQGKRYDIQGAHGFRKRFNTILKLNSSVNSNVAEKLMGHKNGLDGVYLDPTIEDCFAEFQKAIVDLTIDDSERLLIRNETLEAENSEVKKREQDIKLLKQNDTLKDDALANLADQVLALQQEIAVLKAKS